MNKLLSQEHCVKLERWQGPPHISKVKQYAIVLSFKLILFIQFIQSQKQRDFIYLVCLHIKKNLSLFSIKILSPKLHSAHLKYQTGCF